MPLRILIAQADNQKAAAWRAALQKSGHTVLAVAGRAEQACALLKTLQPDLLLVDTRLPPKGGIPAVALIREIHPGPVILVGEDLDPAFRQRARQAGAFICLIKPPYASGLAPALALAWQNFCQMRALEKKTGALRKALTERQYLERAKGILMQRLGLSEKKALARIKEQSRLQNVSLAEAARQIITAQELDSLQNLQPNPPAEKALSEPHNTLDKT